MRNVKLIFQKQEMKLQIVHESSILIEKLGKGTIKQPSMYIPVDQLEMNLLTSTAHLSCLLVDATWI